jgi:hypothetical protein
LYGLHPFFLVAPCIFNKHIVFILWNGHLQIFLLWFRKLIWRFKISFTSVLNGISWKGQPRVNTTIIAITYHFSCKLHIIIVENCFQLLSTGGWNPYVNWAWHHPKI